MKTFKIVIVDGSEADRTIEAYYAEEAAVEFAEEYDLDTYDIIDGHVMEVTVEDEEGVRETFLVEGEMERIYSARVK